MILVHICRNDGCSVVAQGKGKVGTGADGKFDSPKLRASTRARVDEAAEFREYRDQVLW